MSQNPYAQFGSPAGNAGAYGGDFEQFPTPSRTSALAIMALVFSLLCFIPGAGALAIIFGGAAILFISNSRGRLGGLGLAIAGVLIGLLTTVIWIIVVMMVVSGTRLMFDPVNGMMAAAEAKDFAKVRTYFSPTLDAAVTDEQIAEFVDAYRAEAGPFQEIPVSLTGIWRGYAQSGSALQNFNGNNMFPMPASFQNAQGFVVYGLPAGSAQPNPGQFLPPATNLGIILSPQKSVWLLDPTTFLPVDNSPGQSTAPATADPDADADSVDTDETTDDQSGG